MLLNKFIPPQLDSNIHISQVAKECLTATFKLFSQINGFSYFENFDEISSDTGSSSSKVAKKNSGGKDKFDWPCSYCQEFDDYNCPNHYHLYSTDEASTSEIDFAVPTTSKRGKGKAKKQSKEVKKNKEGVLFNFAKLFTQ